MLKEKISKIDLTIHLQVNLKKAKYQILLTQILFYQMEFILQILVLILVILSLTTIRRYAQKSWRYMDVYRKGISGRLAEFAVKKYRSHRRIPDSVYDEVKI